jgi:hypothetical protein
MVLGEAQPVPCTEVPAKAVLGVLGEAPRERLLNSGRQIVGVLQPLEARGKIPLRIAHAAKDIRRAVAIKIRVVPVGEKCFDEFAPCLHGLLEHDSPPENIASVKAAASLCDQLIRTCP